MKTLPREHGLIVSWVLTIVAAALLSKEFHAYGIGLVVFLLPTLLVYDRLIVGLRLWSIGKMGLAQMLTEKVGSRALALLLVALAYLVAGLLLRMMPWIPVLVTVSVLVSEGAAFRYLRERHIITRALSILTVTSQFLLINSALSGGVSTFEVIAFALISVVNLQLVADVVQQVETFRMPQGGTEKWPSGVDAPFLVVGVAAATAISALVSVYYLSFVVLLLTIQVAFRYLLPGRSMKTVGAVSSAVEVLALLLLVVRFYASM